jgi:hypothetical protein
LIASSLEFEAGGEIVAQGDAEHNAIDAADYVNIEECRSPILRLRSQAQTGHQCPTP